MTNRMTYRGYAARVEYDHEDSLFARRIAGIRDGVGLHADTAEDLKKAFREAVDDYVETCATIGNEPQRPGRGTNQTMIPGTA